MSTVFVHSDGRSVEIRAARDAAAQSGLGAGGRAASGGRRVFPARPEHLLQPTPLVLEIPALQVPECSLHIQLRADRPASRGAGVSKVAVRAPSRAGARTSGPLVVGGCWAGAGSGARAGPAQQLGVVKRAPSLGEESPRPGPRGPPQG